MNRRPPRVVDLDAVRASRARLDALAREHPELCSPDARERAAAWLANEPDEPDDPHRGKAWPPTPGLLRPLATEQIAADRDRLARVVVDALVVGGGRTTLWDLDGVVVDPTDRATMRIVAIPYLRRGGFVRVDVDVVHLLRRPDEDNA